MRPPRPWIRGLLALFLGACGPSSGAPGPRWVSLTGQAAGAGAQALGGVEERVVQDAVRIVPVGSDVVFESEYGPDDWILRKKRYWSARLIVAGRGAPADGTPPHRLTDESGREYRLLDRWEVREEGADLAGGFFVHTPRISLFLEEGATPPAKLTLRSFARRADAEGDGPRVTGERLSGDALPVWPGEHLDLRVDVPEDASLRFATGFEPSVSLDVDAQVTFRIYRDGRLVFEHGFPYQDEARLDYHEVQLEPGAGVPLRFEVLGLPAYTSFFAPGIGPREPGSYGARPWDRVNRGRPNIVLFQADTFRADNLRVYGGERSLAPFLDGLARRSLFFPNAWSVGTFTLPTHASLFTGLYPHQVGIQSPKSSLPREALTLAELLSRSGYRCGAITDSVYVSGKFGMDQGFETFDEVHGDFDSTLERAQAFLDADDGRPIFLFLQTYRTHMPYLVSEETRKSHGEVLELVRDFRSLSQEFNRIEDGRLEVDAQRRRATIDGLLEHYRGTVVDLDRGAQEFHRRLDQAGVFRNGYFLFTSDHGEAFEEHDEMYHGGKVWEELLRVPLFLHGPTIEPRRVERPVSLVDLAPTVAELAGVQGSEDWVGESLLGDGTRRPIFAFECGGRGASLAVIEGLQKVIASESSDELARDGLLHAFDLAADPAERRDLSASPWARELLERRREQALHLLQPKVESQGAALSTGDLDLLDAMGYGGKDW